MRFGLVQEGEFLGNSDPYRRYHEMIEEVILADEVGFHVYGGSEQHFSAPMFAVSAPEVLYSAMAMQTKNILFREMCAILLKWNHPILVAERLATLDIISHGRSEIATARSNNLYTLDAFGVKAEETAAMWDEGMEVLIKALTTEDMLEHEGHYWKIPPRPLVPRCVQKPHPKVFAAASSPKTHRKCGLLGIGAISFDNYFGYDYMDTVHKSYREGLAESTDARLERNVSITQLMTSAYCAETREEAVRIARKQALDYFALLVDMYTKLSQHGTYEYLDRMQLMTDNVGNLDFIMRETPSVLIGTPDDWITELRMLEERGVDEVILRIDGVPTEDVKRSIELIGREVIPAVNGTAAAKKTAVGTA
jgi:alkanesulfonate monooxygenase SsuD/methylene tetrahydromethanopterin reductase-like flavin-dependent oxidoreductase (luciferase family)